ncbi:MAG: acyl-CoA/acyl-ACP dehydrogenase [Betaproteobacteria bacterium]|nr:MAG: acyl-CoA/acyl-ACP dehydrogenase [Betaproteobacteria bacterium]
MNAPLPKNIEITRSTSHWHDQARSLGEEFAKRAPHYDRTGSFVSANYGDLRQHRFFSAGIPAELGGGGATYADLSHVIREIGRHCGSTALAFAMHTHPVAANIYKHLRGEEAATKTLLKLAKDELIIAGTGANDWLDSSGNAEPVDGGYLVNARKRFVSGAPGADLLVTSVTHAGTEGNEILHFAIPFSAKGVSIVETWNALGMRATGSHDVVLENVFVPAEKIVGRRPAGVWHPMWNVILPTAMPLIVSAYVGLAEAAAELAISAARHKQAVLAPAVGDMLNALTTAQLALADMVRLNDNHGFAPSTQLASDILARKAIAAEAVKATVESAAELVGGPGFFNGHPIERMVRDVRAIHFHPLPLRRQQIFSGRVALGFDPVSSPE